MAEEMKAIYGVDKMWAQIASHDLNSDKTMVIQGSHRLASEIKDHDIMAARLILAFHELTEEQWPDMTHGDAFEIVMRFVWWLMFPSVVMSDTDIDRMDEQDVMGQVAKALEELRR